MPIPYTEGNELIRGLFKFSKVREEKVCVRKIFFKALLINIFFG